MIFFKERQSSLKSKDGIRKWHPSLVKVGGTVSTHELGEMIAEKSSLTPGDVHNTIRNLMTCMRLHLLNSRSVKLDGLGTFTVICKSNGKGVNTKEEVSPAQITNLKVQFRPEYTRPRGGTTTRAMFEKVNYAYWGDALAEEGGGFNPSE